MRSPYEWEAHGPYSLPGEESQANAYERGFAAAQLHDAKGTVYMDRQGVHGDVQTGHNRARRDTTHPQLKSTTQFSKSQVNNGGRANCRL